MRKIINGRMYDTDTANFIGSRDNGFMCNDFHYVYEELYRKRTGEYFLYGEGGAMSCYSVSVGNNSWGYGEAICPLDKSEAKEWAERHLTADEYIEEFGEPEE